jgi:hypothetical protein
MQRHLTFFDLLSYFLIQFEPFYHINRPGIKRGNGKKLRGNGKKMEKKNNPNPNPYPNPNPNPKKVKIFVTLKFYFIFSHFFPFPRFIRGLSTLFFKIKSKK